MDYQPRVSDALLLNALRRSGAVQVLGPKWCGKTTSAEQVAASVRYFQDPDQRRTYQQLGQEKPSLLLRGDKPLLLDEWQDVPQVWDAVRYAVDRDPTPGQYLLTGSAVPSDQASSEISHSGTGRFARVRMRPMSLFESGDSNGSVSLASLFAGFSVDAESLFDNQTAAWALTRGGWPASVVDPGDASLERPRDYVDSLVESDISRVDGVEKNPNRVKLLLRALARNESTEATNTTLQKDVAGDQAGLAMNTVSQYLQALRRLFVLDEQDAWPLAVRAKVVQRTKPIRRFCDPSLSVALLRLTPDKLLADFNIFGLLFESMAVRDLRVYAEAAGCMVYHYRDARGLKTDAIVERGDGAWGAVEVKLGSGGHQAASDTLLRIKHSVRSQHGGAPSFLLALTNESFAYTDTDGINWVPLGCLGP
ncbi:MAG: DUF4143 domain-containing protein [Micrococcales bacterium]|nr:DUF4143 domain-containing protein [Micrococcales bacterium]